MISSGENRELSILAGTPPTIMNGATSRVTRDPAAIIAPSPMVTPDKIIEPNPIQTSSPIMTFKRGGYNLCLAYREQI